MWTKENLLSTAASWFQSISVRPIEPRGTFDFFLSIFRQKPVIFVRVLMDGDSLTKKTLIPDTIFAKAKSVGGIESSFDL